MRLIDADELERTFIGKHYGVNAIKYFIKIQPTIDSVRHGRWEEREVIEQEMSNIEDWQSARCSVCGKYHTTPYLYGFNDYPYCPNCGAIMDEVEE